MANIVVSGETLWAFVGQLINKFCPIMPRYLNRQNMADDMIEALNRIIQEYNQCSNKEDFDFLDSFDQSEIWPGIVIGLDEPYVGAKKGQLEPRLYDNFVKITTAVAKFLTKQGMVIDE